MSNKLERITQEARQLDLEKRALPAIIERADSSKPNIGLITWEKAPVGKILKSDVSIAKNYLTREELAFCALIYFITSVRQKSGRTLFALFPGPCGIKPGQPRFARQVDFRQENRFCRPRGFVPAAGPRPQGGQVRFVW